MENAHYVGFEKEEKFHEILRQARSQCSVIMARTIKTIILHVNEEFMDGLFEIRPCVRRLRYVGCGCIECEFPNKKSPHNSFFKLGEVYESIDYNGGTYSFEGYERRIGSAHFEIVQDGR